MGDSRVPDTYRQILRRVGLVLVVVGALDLGVMVYCIINRIAYSSSLNIFAIIAGALLLRGGLRTASLTRWFGMFMLSASVAVLGALPFVQPLDLSLTEIRLRTGPFVAGVVVYVLLVSMLVWVQRQLGREPVVTAIENAGLKNRNMSYPALAGVGLVVLLGIAIPLITNGETAARARTLVRQQVGPGYKLHVESISVTTGGQGSTASGMVVAWNDHEIRRVPFNWKD